MITSLFQHERIETTDAKAKELRRLAEKVITMAKHGAQFSRQAEEAGDDNDRQRLQAASVNKRRQAALVLRQSDILRKLFTQLEERYRDRPGGYTRIIKLGFRRGDSAPISMVELVDTQVGVADAGAEGAAGDSATN